MSSEFEFFPALTYEEVLRRLPEGLRVDPAYGDHCTESARVNREKGIEGGALYREGIRHRLVLGIDVRCGCWLSEKPNGHARVEVFGMQTRSEDGGHEWWIPFFRKRWPDREVWDMCNGPDGKSPPLDGYRITCDMSRRQEDTAWLQLLEKFWPDEVVEAAVFGAWCGTSEPEPSLVPAELRGVLVTDVERIRAIFDSYVPILESPGVGFGYHFTIWTDRNVYFTTGPADGILAIEAVPRAPTAYEPSGGWPGERSEPVEEDAEQT